MKKLLSLFAFLFLFVAVTCEDEPLDDGIQDQQQENSCQQAGLDVAAAALAYVTEFQDGNLDNFTQVCNDYKNALQAMIEACGDPDGTIQQSIDLLGDCVNPDDLTDCQAAEMASTNAQVILNNAPESEYETSCQLYVSALENQIQECGDADGSIQAMIDDLGDCSVSDNQNDADIEGTWLLTAWIGEEPIDLNNDGTENTNFLNEMDCYNNELLEFNAGGNGLSTSNSYADFSFVIEVGTTDSFIYTIDCIQEFDEAPFTWSHVSGNTYTVTTVDDDDFDVTIDGNQLSIFVPQGFIAFNSDDATVTTIQDLTFVYTKQ